jgi:adenosylmethionine-8-amino-7-oxononanoate aminotransferase
MTQNSKSELDNVRAALRLGHAACANDQRYASLNVIDEALRILDSLQAKAAQVSDEPVAWTVREDGFLFVNETRASKEDSDQFIRHLSVGLLAPTVPVVHLSKIRKLSLK